MAVVVSRMLGLRRPVIPYWARLSFRNGARKSLGTLRVIPPPALEPRVPITAIVLREGQPSVSFLITLRESSSNNILAHFLPNSPPQTFRRSVVYKEMLAQAFEYTEPRLGVTRWPTLSETANTLLFNITDASDNQVSTVPATVDLQVKVDSLAAIREAVVIERMDDGQWRVAGYGNSLKTALAEIALEVTTSGALYAVGLDDYGVAFVGGLSLPVGARVRPTHYVGWLYEITEAGTLPATEPTWWPAEGDNASRLLGTARAIAVRYYQPLAHGPLPVELL
jgi:hypothetical protein